MMLTQKNAHEKGFTIVELTVVIIVIAILAAVGIIGYGSWRTNTQKAAVASDTTAVSSQMEASRNFGNAYPTTLPSTLADTDQTTYTYVYGDATSFCIEGKSKTNASIVYYISNTSSGKAVLGSCPTQSVTTAIQTVTTANCPATRTPVFDARDNRTYWVQKLADGKCWMLTNLAYAGGGTNTYGDTKTLTDGSSESTYVYTARYYASPSANASTNPTQPSTSTDGGVTNPQYGYLYNWCGAMGGQATAACAYGSTPAPVTTTSVCPSGWRLPTGNGGELSALNTAVNGGSTTSNSGLLTTWLGQWSGAWYTAFSNGTNPSVGFYWSSTMMGTGFNAYILTMNSNGSVNPTTSNDKRYGYAVRCIAV